MRVRIRFRANARVRIRVRASARVRIRVRVRASVTANNCAHFTRPVRRSSSQKRNLQNNKTMNKQTKK